MIPGSGMARKGATVVSETASAYGQKKIREDTDDNAALDAAEQMELAGESLARKSIYVRERLKENRQRNNRLRESVLEEMEKSRLQFGTSASNEAKKAVQKEAEQKKLRKAYLAAIRKNLRGSLNRIDIQNKDGSIENLGEKYGKKLDKN